MLSLILFLVSFSLVIFSSLFFTVSLKEKKLSNFLIYFVLIFISQNIVSFEILSLFKSITFSGVLINNVIFSIVSVVLWLREKAPFPNFKEVRVFFTKFFKTIRSDKILLVLFGLFIFSSLISLFYVIAVPTCNMDSHAYKLARVALWIQHKSLAHFEVTDLSQIIYPINYEIMELWPQVFLKRDFLSIFPAFISYFASLSLVFIFLKNLKVSIKRALWAVLILGSVPIVLLESTSTQSDLFLGFLLFTSFYLFSYAIKNNKKLPLIFSSIAYAVALGTKSTAIILTPVFVIVYALMSIREQKKEFYIPLCNFIVYLVPAFLILSSYNYILNYMAYGNFIAPVSFLSDNVMPDVKTFIAAVVLYIIYFADFSGITAITALNQGIINYFTAFISLFGLKINDVVFKGIFEGVNWRIHENHSSFGLLGYLVIFPIMILALIKIRTKRDRTFYVSICGIFLSIFTLILISTMGFSVYNFRYFTTAIVLTAPILAFSYTKKPNFYKILISSVIAFNFIVITLFNNQKPLFKVISLIPKFNNFIEYRNDLRLRNAYNFNGYESEYVILDFAKKFIPNNSKIGLIYDTDDVIYPFFETNKTWKIYPVRYDELFKRKNFNDYDYVIVQGNYQTLNYLTSDVVWDYYPDPVRRMINFTNEGQDVAKILYINRKAEILFEGQEKPAKMVNIIEDQKLSSHYRKIIEIPIKYPYYERDRLYRIYSKQ